MKKIIVLLCILLFSSSAFALVGINFYGGLDMCKIDKQEYFHFKLNEASNDSVFLGLGQEAIENPFLLGTNVYIDIPLSKFSVVGTGEVSFKNYKMKYDNDFFYPPNGQHLSKDLIYARVSALASLRYTFLKLPPVVKTVSIYAGAGVGVHFITPIFCEDLVKDNLDSCNDKLDEKEIVKKQSKFGYHLLAGAKIKPPLFPVGFVLEGRYIFLTDTKYKVPDNFISIVAGIQFGF